MVLIYLEMWELYANARVITNMRFLGKIAILMGTQSERRPEQQ